MILAGVAAGRGLARFGIWGLLMSGSFPGIREGRWLEVDEESKHIDMAALPGTRFRADPTLGGVRFAEPFRIMLCLSRGTAGELGQIVLAVRRSCCARICAGTLISVLVGPRRREFGDGVGRFVFDPDAFIMRLSLPTSRRGPYLRTKWPPTKPPLTA